MTAEQFQDALRELQIPRKHLAENLGVARETASRWANGQLPVPQYAIYAITLLRRLHAIEQAEAKNWS